MLFEQKMRFHVFGKYHLNVLIDHDISNDLSNLSISFVSIGFIYSFKAQIVFAENGHF